jgi:hypothetical protein
MRENREETPAYLHGSWEYLGREPRFSRSPVFEIALFCTALYPIFAIITGVLKHLFTEPPSKADGTAKRRSRINTPVAIPGT